MKDKLEKSGHKHGYYRKQFALKASLIALGFFSLCAIPIGLSYRVAEVTHAEQEESSSQLASSQEEREETSESSPNEEEKNEIPQESQEN